MVSSEKVWDPLHAGLIQSPLSEQHLAPGLTPRPQTAAKDATCHQSQRLTPWTSPPLSLVALDALQAVKSSSPLHPPVNLYGLQRIEGLHKPAWSCGLASQSEEEKEEEEEEEEEGETEQLEMKSKRHGGRGEALMEDRLEDMVDGPKNAKITLSFPLSAAPLPASLTSPNHCRSSSSSSPSPHRRRPSSKSSDEGSLWKLDATMDVKHRPFKPPRHDSSPSSSPSSSSSPMTVHALIRKDIKSPPPLKCSKLNPETQFQRSPPRSSSGSLGACYGVDGWDERHRIANGTVSPSQTAQILFSLGKSAYQSCGDAERREKITGRPAGKLGIPHGPSLHPPTLHLPPPLPPPPPPPSEGLTAPPHSSSYSPTDSLKPELICGVCHRLFSSASSLTVHMRLHRGSRALSCRFCGKVFIHSKRLQSHEASCKMPGLPSSSLGPPPLTVQPKEEPLEEGEVRVEGGMIVGETDISKARPGKKARSLLARIQGDDAADAELLAGDEHHFVKVVDGNVIYFCSVCERSYMTLSSLKRHSNVHSWRRKYPCHYCDKVFALAEYRTKHEVWHTGERRYQCIFCWDAFATYYNLKTHQKTIHGINPSLISSEKTANGGYKQKANALKLYRLLPMRSQKRPYKTYSDSLHNGLLLPPSDTPPLSLPGLGGALGSGDLQSLISGAHPQSVKPDPDAFPDDFPVSVAPEHRDLSGLTPLPQADVHRVKNHESEARESEQGRGSGNFKMSSSNKTKTPKTGKEASMPSVITYGHSKPSVIVHGTAVSSSVIVHSNQVISGSEKSPISCPSPETSNSQTSHKGSPRPIKKQRDSADGHRKRSRDNSETRENGSTSRGGREAEAGRSFHKSRKSHSRSDTSNSKQPPSSGGSHVREAGPLCQITVRIGEEAIVKRSISETDLRRDKSLSPPKSKRSETSREVKDPRHSHFHHHHHKHRQHRRASMEEEEEEEEDDKEGDCEDEEVRKKRSKSPDGVREYYFRREVREQDSDHDMEDNLWRPYYSYKPKRKAQAHLQRVKSWQRKLKYKRSIQLKRRAERLKNCVNKETEKSQDEEEDGTNEEPQKPDRVKGEGKKRVCLSAPLKDKSKDTEEQEACHKAASIPLHSPKPPPSTSGAPMGIKRRPWTNGNAAECGTCGRWFSSPRKRDKHELSHLLEFVCLFCRATFPSWDKLEDHQRAQHPKPTDAPSAPPKVALVEQDEGVGIKSVPETSKYDEERGGQVGLSGRNSSPSRLSRRALSRHTCPQCHKVCKTSSALTRHIRRHELSSSPEREREDKAPEPKTTEAVINDVSRDVETEKAKAPSALSVSVISYSTPDPPIRVDCLASQQHEGRLSELTAEHHTSESTDKPQPTGLTHPAVERQPSPQTADPPLESPVSLTPTKNEFTPAAPSALQSVLVMNGAECLDYRSPSRKSLDSQIYRIPSPVHVVAPANTSPNVPVTSQTRITAAAAPVSMTTAPGSEGGFVKRDGVIMDRERLGGSGVFLHAGYEEAPRVQDLRVPSLSRSPSPDEAQDLTMSSMLARERAIVRQRETEREKERQRQREREREKEKAREREREMERAQKMSRFTHAPEDQMALLVPKEEPLSPVQSPQHIPTQTTMNGPSSHRHTPKSPRRSPSIIGLLSHANRQVHSGSQGLDRLTLPTGAAGAGDRPSAHALQLPRAPQPPEPEHQDTVSSRDSQQGGAPPVGYPAQDYPLPLIVPDSYRSAKKQDDNLLMSYPGGHLPFGPLGKVMVPHGGDLSKLPFYPDPYQLLYGPQLLAYPYNLAALPVALNMMAPGGDKMETMPFLPAIFNYAAAAGPYMGTAPHPLVANPSLYSGGSGSGKKQRDSSGKP
ncbi:zinc finger and BTB domain-containing protein 4 [Pleuronectes platessa]|uniref:zinc finger and BTB domain-containing protein 4 n=1 Tax=Pleuronectes platessa TaxID=8262 RepID=UPI00232A60DC|nr:zinc finger and BTB domain-containing protein 4 [Pleuronectes platessa]XP_053271685.1 zinc finger and BTB domain-containing protein 4 [Pleuronectes platessa]XP_053271686.1 zinc finger and BTB domain-containing protein 4 [Pleuronectes platessa]XP_053271687.1 zinc finger and BTB domain-containing protein 4 [Pleuronectes platessa]XP_053271689.1 zinc finger and BTB domain-containing protein 4 [Pleuronectes platessa]XP_053271690.1 zinc finger and BTB domain-containing protein 4 [Pleuronectes pla